MQFISGSESTEEQQLNGLSLPAQKKALIGYARSKGYEIVGCYADEGISARKSMLNRKGLLTLLEDVKCDKIDMILVTKLDRWFRNIRDYNTTEEILQAHNCHWKTIFENYDSSTANGQMVINIMLSVNQAECDRTSERIKAVLDYKRSIGEVTSGRCACYGYIVENNRLVKDASVSHIIDDAYAHYFSCYSIRGTISFLNGKYGSLAPSAYQVERLFKNETYAGKNRENIQYCEPYITPEQFLKARQIARSKSSAGSSREPYLFSSLIKCPWCGCNYTGYRRRQKLKNGRESIYIKYRCGSKFGRHGCAHFTEHKVEEYMLSHIMQGFYQETVTLTFPSDGRSIKKEPDNILAELNRLKLLFQKGHIAEKYYDEQYLLLDGKLRELKKEKETVLTGSQDTSLKELNGSWPDLYQKLDRTHKNAFWKSILSCIVIDRETHQIKGFHFLT